MLKQSLADILRDNTGEGVLYEKTPEGMVRCFACAHRCLIPEWKSGVCRVRYNRWGKLYVPFGYVAALQDDPIEKKPFYHALPGSRAMSFGMLGCDYHCSFCQNWITSQVLQDPEASGALVRLDPREIVRVALQRHCQVITSTYNEPLITTEWAVEIFREAKKAGLVTSYVSNGNATLEVLDYLQPWMDLFKVDLKGFSDQRYRELGGTLQAVCQTIQELYKRGIWIEVVTLLVPGFNNSHDEIKRLTEFLVSVSPDIPWHVTAFHPDYKMLDLRSTTATELVRAARIAKRAGIRYVYAGNLPGMAGSLENTYCHGCRELLVKRFGFQILLDKISPAGGICPKCQTKIPGFWKKTSSGSNPKG
ncbi:MAG: AmmeMemoRadiSam system radical SAM enzyme [Candidatus Omnitrophica bacterium]|nr:AmmeMemoRadiSam system radical SAM enzyme [Candidatus Omnitrophota bacterium]